MGKQGNSRILELIQRADWDDIYPRAIKYALSKLSFRAGSPYKGVLKEDVAEGIVNEAIKKTLEGCVHDGGAGPTKGVRKWEPEKVSLLDYLLSVIKSDISHLYESESYNLTSRMPVSPQNDGGSESIETEELLTRAHELDKHAAEISPDPPQSVDDILIEHEICDRLLKVIEGEDELESIVLCMLDGYSKPRDIAEQLSVEPKNIYNAKKRLERAYQGLLQKNSKETS